MNEPHRPTRNPYDPTRQTPTNAPIAPAPGGPFPPAWPPGPPAPPPPGNRRMIWLLAGLVCVLTVIAVVLTVTLVGRDQHESPQSTTKSSSAASDRSPVPVSALDELFPDKELIRSAAAEPGLGLVDKGDAMFPPTAVDASCQATDFIAANPVYAGSGWSSVRWQAWNSPPEIAPETLVRSLLMSAVSYPSSESAQAFYTKQRAAWQSCAGRIVNLRITNSENAADSFWTVGKVIDADDVLSTVVIAEGGGAWSCQSTMALRNNIVAQVNICGETTPSTAARDIIDAITAKVDAAA